MKNYSSFVTNQEDPDWSNSLREKTRKNIEVETKLPQSKKPRFVEVVKVEKIFEEDYEYDKKEASILDYPRKSLDPDIWDLSKETPRLHNQVAFEIVDRLMKLLTQSGVSDDSIVRGTYFVGSSATRQWDEDSDIDITVLVPDEYADQIKEHTPEINEQFLSGTSHPVNFFVRSDELPLSFTDALYDIDQQVWLKAPQLLDEEFDPEEKYKYVFEQAKSWAQKLDVQTAELSRDTIDFDNIKKAIGRLDGEGISFLEDKLESKVKEINSDIKGLVQDLSSIHELRLKAFEEDLDNKGEEAVTYMSRNWLPANVIYKYLEKYRYIQLLKALKKLHDKKEEMPKEEYIEEVKEVLKKSIRSNKMSVESKKVALLFEPFMGKEAQTFPPIAPPEVGERAIPPAVGIVPETDFPPSPDTPLGTADEIGDPAVEATEPPEVEAEELLDILQNMPERQNERQVEVVNAISNLRKSLVDTVYAVHKIRFTENQVKEVTEKIIALLGESVSDITNERVKDIAKDLLPEKE